MGSWIVGPTPGSMVFTTGLMQYTLDDNLGVSVPRGLQPEAREDDQQNNRLVKHGCR